MSTTNEAEIRERWARTDVPEMLFTSHVRGDVTFLLAEVDRLTRELAAVTEERDRSIRNTDASIANTESALSALAALRAAYTWTRATSATMPPVGAGPWLVRFGGDGTEMRKCLYVDYEGFGLCWMTVSRFTNLNECAYKTVDTEWCELPADAPAQDGGGDAEVTA